LTDINHPAELALHKYLGRVVNGKAGFSKETAIQISRDIQDAVLRQFGRGKRDQFRLRMSNVGRPYCQLWFDKNKPEAALPKPTTFVMNMLLGDIIEAIFKGLLKESEVKYIDSEKVTLRTKNAEIDGTFDLVIDGAVDDVKSASDWSYKNKFASYQVLKDNDAFGYVGQLAGYAKATGQKPGGWWVINKANGQFKYVPADIDLESEIQKIEDLADKLRANEFERSYEPQIETFRGKETGNKVLCKECTFCDYRYTCWPNVQERPAVKSQAKEPKMVHYVQLVEEKSDGE